MTTTINSEAHKQKKNSAQAINTEHLDGCIAYVNLKKKLKIIYRNKIITLKLSMTTFLKTTKLHFYISFTKNKKIYCMIT